MDGVIVAYHNSERIFGFQYIPLREMDARLLGPEEGLGEKVFGKCIGLLEAILPEAAACYPEQVCVSLPLMKCLFLKHTINNPLVGPVHIRDADA